jgi:transient receptor potential cation channel subfamily M protein 3
MLQSMTYFIVILFVILFSYGVCRQAILHPGELSWYFVLEIFMEPYLMLFGEVFAESINPECGDGPDMKKCEAGVWINAIEVGLYLLVANILLINLLIAIFNNIISTVRAISHQVWMFQHFTVVKEYKQTPVLPAPLIVLCHIFMFLKYCRHKVSGTRELNDNALKLFLDRNDLERLRDFERKCVEGYFQKQETKFHYPNDECLKNTSKRVYQKVEENNPTSAIQRARFKIRKLEDLTNQMLSNLTVIHQPTNVQDP